MAYISFQPKDYFNTKLYTGNSTDNHAITGVGFAPDFTWIKNRTQANFDHMLFDALRGTGSLRENLRSNTTSASDADASNLKTLDSDGFTLGTGGYVNHASTFVSWNWLANGQGSSNTDGSINTTYTSANTTSGFSIIKYTGTGSAGATIGHGLGVKPAMIIIKNLNITQDWVVYHQAITANKILYLNMTNDPNDNNVFFNDTEPTNSLITLGSNSTVNGSGNSHIAYCFAEKKGFSKFGSYTGNGNIDGPFNYCGFKPAFLMLKKTSGTGDWFINDVKRNTFNVVNTQLYPNLNAAEENVNATQLDILSNGFKLRGTTSNALNSGNDTYIFMAFAEAPLVSSNGVPATAR